MSHTVGELAKLAGVTVRTLHHYDRVGLLVPSGRTSAGYRVYERADVDRLHQQKDPLPPTTRSARRGTLQGAVRACTTGLVPGPAASLLVVGRTRSFWRWWRPWRRRWRHWRWGTR